jgi:23S rRNA pseudouridine2605 synthase
VLGTKADPQRDTITVDNQAIPKEQAAIYVALNKPQAVLSEVNPDESENRETVRDLVPVPGHLFIVGRLDYESEGLILLTNDGDLANRLTHPRFGHEKEYRVQVSERPDDRQYEAWRHGIVLEDGYRTAPAQVRLESASGRNFWLRVILNEGRKRQIREMGLRTGLRVQRIQRIRIGTLLLGDLKPGQWRHLRPDEVRALKITKLSGRSKPRVRIARRSDQPATDQRGPETRGPENRRSDRRGPAQRGSEPRSSEQRGPETRGPENRGPDRRGSTPRGTETRRPERRGPDQRRRK